MQDTYYWAITGRILFDDEDTTYCTDSPTTNSEARDQFYYYLRKRDPNAYAEHGSIITAEFRSTQPIECTWGDRLHITKGLLNG